MDTIEPELLIKQGYCSFDVAKQLLESGIDPHCWELSYDDNGELGDGGWLFGITDTKFYPAPDLFQALLLLGEGIDIEPDIQFHNNQFRVILEDQDITAPKLVDALCLMYLDIQKRKPQIQ